MSNERQETVADIVAEMRKDIAEGTVGIWSDFGGEIARRYADRIEEAWKREVAELHKCLNEAIREKCPFTRMSCKHGETCDYECGTVKWRKALREEGGAR